MIKKQKEWKTQAWGTKLLVNSLEIMGTSKRSTVKEEEKES